MILDGICPECKETIITGPHGTNVVINLPGLNDPSVVSFSCAGCGYTVFFADSKSVNLIKRKGKKSFLFENRKTECNQCNQILRPQDRYCPGCGNSLF